TLFTATADAAPDDLRLNPPGQAQTFPFIWISNTNDGTVSKFDTRTGKELGRYRTGPDGIAGQLQPARTAVSGDGSVWVANRAFGIQASMIHVLSDGFIDRNGNGVMDTSQDLDNDGHVTGAEIFPWDANGDGQPDDERIALSV